MKRADGAQAVMRRIGLKLVADRKAEILAEMNTSGEKDPSKSGVRGRDLLTMLIKANMTIDDTNGQRLNDEEVLGREYSDHLQVSGLNNCSQRFRRTSLTYKTCH